MKAREARDLAHKAKERMDLAKQTEATEQVSATKKVIHEAALQGYCEITTSKPLSVLAQNLLRKDGYGVKDCGAGFATSWEISW